MSHPVKYLFLGACYLSKIKSRNKIDIRSKVCFLFSSFKIKLKMFKNITLILIFHFFVVFYSSNAAKTYNSGEGRTKIYISNKSVSPIMFQMIENISSNLNIQISTTIEESEENIYEKIQLGNKGGILITDSYELLKKLKDDGTIQFAYTSEIFYEKLVYIPTRSSENLAEESLKDAIFLKTSKREKDIIDNFTNKLPSILIESANICKKIDTMQTLYEYSHSKIILKESIARKCRIKTIGSFDDIYSLYYMAILATNNFNTSKKVFDFIENSKTIKEIIKRNGYNS